MLLPPAGRAAPWWNPEWKFRQEIRVAAPPAPPERGPGFPLRVRLEDASFARTLAQPGGSDLRAISADGRALDLEVVTWADNDVVLHVGIPESDTSAGLPAFHLYFGNPRATPAVPAELWRAPHLAMLPLSGDRNNLVVDGAGVTRVGYVIQNGWGPGLITERNERWLTFSRDFRGYITLTSANANPRAGFTFATRFRTDHDAKMTVLAGKTFELIVENGRIVYREGDASLSLPPAALGAWHSIVLQCDPNGNRTLLLDDAPPVSLSVRTEVPPADELRIGRSFSDDPLSQFAGDVEAVHLRSGVLSPPELRLLALNLSDAGSLATVGSLEGAGGPPPPPAPHLTAPSNDARSYKPAGSELRWLPAAGAAAYRIQIFAEENSKYPLATYAADASGSFQLTRDLAGADTVYWSVAASSEHGETRSAPRKLAFVSTPPVDVQPETPRLSRADDLTIELRGYLGERVERLARYMVDFPARNPGLLRMLRDRPEKNVPSWAGVFAGQYLSSAQLMWRLTRNPELAARLDAFVPEFLATQRADGYLAPFEGIGSAIELWNHYAVIIGLLDRYEDTGDEAVLLAARRAADLIIRTFGPDATPLPKSGGAAEPVAHAMIRLHDATNDPRYLAFVHYLVHEAWNEPGGVAFHRLGRERAPLSALPVRRWESVHSLLALSELYWKTGDSDSRAAFEHIWRMVRNTERHNTGGFSTNEGLLGTPYNRGTIETCCTVAWTLLTTDMLRLTRDSSAADELEWSTLNSALGSIPYDGTCSTYATQPDGLRQFLMLRQGPPDGIELNCCSTNAARAIGNLSAWALMRSEDGLALNFYGPSKLSADLPSGNRVSLEQITDYPANGAIRLELTLREPETFTLELRIPSWSTHTTFRINDELQPNPTAGGYASLHRRWSSGDTISLELDFTPRFEIGREDFAGKVSIFRGPLLLASDARYTTNRLPHADPVAIAGLAIEPLAPPPGPGPWFLARVTDGAGQSFTVCDFSSAGLFADPYRSWFDLAPSAP